MPLQTNPVGIRPIERPQAPSTEGVSRRGDGSGSSGFTPQTNVSLKTAINDLSSILSKIGTTQDAGMEKMPQDLQKIVQNIMRQAFSVEETLSQGIGSTLESQRFSLEQLTAFSRMLTQLGALTEKGFSLEISDNLQALLTNLKAYVTDSEGAQLSPVLLNKTAFELLDTKISLEDLSATLQLLLAGMQGASATAAQPVGDSDALGFLKQLVQYFMPKQAAEGQTQQEGQPQQTAQNQQANQQAQTNQPQAGQNNAANRPQQTQNQNAPQQTQNQPQGQNATGQSQNTPQQAQNQNSAPGQPQQTSEQLTQQNQPQAQKQPTAPQGNTQQPQGNTQQQTQTGQNQTQQTSANQPQQTQTSQQAQPQTQSPSPQSQSQTNAQQPPTGQQNQTIAGQNSSASANMSGNAQGQPTANTPNQPNSTNLNNTPGTQGQNSATAEGNAQNRAEPQNQNTTMRQTPSGQPISTYEVRQAKAQMMAQPLQNTPQTMDTMKSVAQFLLKNAQLTPEDAHLLQTFNGGETVMSDKEARQLQTLLRICQQNVPTTVHQAAIQQNMPELPKLWAFMQLCDIVVAKKMTARQLKKAGKEVADFALSMRNSMGGENSAVQRGRSMNFILPLFMGENEKSYPSYIHVYDEDGFDRDTGEPRKETWLRICVLTDNIGAVDLTCRVYDGLQLDMRLFFSERETANDFRTEYARELKTSLRDTQMKLNELKIGYVGMKDVDVQPS